MFFGKKQKKYNLFYNKNLYFLINMKPPFFFYLTLSLFSSVSSWAQNTPAESWATQVKANILMKKDVSGMAFTQDTVPNTHPTIFVDNQKTFQIMDGFGFTLTGGSAELIYKMSPSARKALLKELFLFNDQNIGLSYLRIGIGATDLSETVYSYNDLPEGETDLNQQKFDISIEKKWMIPLLKEILTINPSIKLMATCWSPPAWMKTNKNTKGGSLAPPFYDAYALYLVNFIKALEKEHITINTLTVQNEPLNPDNNPSMMMLPHEQASFIKNSLSSAFQKAQLKTKIVLYDHNADRPDYPIAVLKDPQVRKLVDGTTFHLYGGTVSNIGELHDLFPEKNLYFTEQWTGAKGDFEGDLNWHMKNIIIGASKNWCKAILEWNLAANKNLGPHTPGGCTECLGALTIDHDEIIRNVSYYIIAHASKFVRPGSKRIFSNSVTDISNVAFVTPTGKHVLILQNDSEKRQLFNVSYTRKTLLYSMEPKSVATLVW
jgi:glucosylceramidase